MNRRETETAGSLWRWMAAWSLAALACGWLVGPADAAKNRGIVVDVPGAEAVLYEVTENMYLMDDSGNVVLPEQATRRMADASLFGWARVGNLLCPAAALVTNHRADTCTVTAAGVDDLSLKTGKGGVSGTFAVVVQDDNATDAPEYVVMNGAFRGEMDLSTRPVGRVSGTFTPSGSSQAVPFCGTLRLPFSVSTKGKREQPKRNGPAYYLADDFQTLLPIHKTETSLGQPTVRFELNFAENCR